MTPEDEKAARHHFEGVAGLYLVSLQMSADLTLRVIVDEAAPEDDPRTVETGNAQLDRALGPSRAVTTRAGHRRFTVVFDPILHAVTDESFASPPAGEDFSTPFRRRDASPFLEWARDSTFLLGHDESGPLSHIALVTYDAVIDVLTRRPAIITVTHLRDADLRT